jgi:hypothetical protein
MRDLAVTAGIITTAGVHGYTKELDARLAHDPAAARKLLADAGYPNGFDVKLDCPNDRYNNDEAICQAVVGMLGKIGVKVTLDAQSKTLHFPKIQKKESDFYLLGWGVPTLDSHYVFNYLYHSKGGWNATRYANPRMDDLTASMETETDLAKRDGMIAQAWKVLRTDYIKFARARGLPDRIVHLGHALRNPLVPVITIAGLQVGSLIAFSIITETVFQWPVHAPPPRHDSRPRDERARAPAGGGRGAQSDRSAAGVRLPPSVPVRGGAVPAGGAASHRRRRHARGLPRGRGGPAARMTYTGQAMTAIRFDHIAIGLPRLADAPAALVGVLGGAPESGGPADAFRWACWRYAGGGRLEAIEPRGPDGFLHRFLAQRGPGVHHVTFKVPSLDATCERARDRGYRIVGYDASDPGWKTAYLHPKDALGIVVQLAEASGPSRPRPWEVPPGPAGAPPAVTLLGLRMRARSGERARAQWEDVLGGCVAETPGGALACRWPDSPMRLVVEIDPAAAEGDEGPVCIEFAAARPVAAPAGPWPGLGTVFAQREAECR